MGRSVPLSWLRAPGLRRVAVAAGALCLSAFHGCADGICGPSQVSGDTALVCDHDVLYDTVADSVATPETDLIAGDGASVDEGAVRGVGLVLVEWTSRYLLGWCAIR